MSIYYEDMDNKLEECGETWLIPPTLQLMRKEKDLWLDLKINIGAWNTGAGINATEEKQTFLKKRKCKQGVAIELWDLIL